jgi:3-oxoacyl-[acyl-carrier protein] reductase
MQRFFLGRGRRWFGAHCPTEIRSSNPSRRFGRPDEFGATCAFLCSAHAGYITGQNILMDGGAYPGTF